ncbi:hypothetical protein E2C01_014106 [Portunus trituberculatus]|uniref:Uncharacterized protein n=1 Tax=Portunus trituberculatus TaxID=210409 RepID=A0A5B7DIB1_PORTR|nr:hypothetical protein [Portunus trituberculatus]
MMGPNHPPTCHIRRLRMGYPGKNRLMRSIQHWQEPNSKEHANRMTELQLQDSTSKEVSRRVSPPVSILVTAFRAGLLPAQDTLTSCSHQGRRQGKWAKETGLINNPKFLHFINCTRTPQLTPKKTMKTIFLE